MTKFSKLSKSKPVTLLKIKKIPELTIKTNNPATAVLICDLALSNCLGSPPEEAHCKAPMINQKRKAKPPKIVRTVMMLEINRVILPSGLPPADWKKLSEKPERGGRLVWAINYWINNSGRTAEKEQAEQAGND